MNYPSLAKRILFYLPRVTKKILFRLIVTTSPLFGKMHLGLLGVPSGINTTLCPGLKFFMLFAFFGFRFAAPCMRSIWRVLINQSAAVLLN